GEACPATSRAAAACGLAHGERKQDAPIRMDGDEKAPDARRPEPATCRRDDWRAFLRARRRPSGRKPRFPSLEGRDGLRALAGLLARGSSSGGRLPTTGSQWRALPSVVPPHSGGAAPESHRVPFSRARVRASATRAQHVVAVSIANPYMLCKSSGATRTDLSGRQRLRRGGGREGLRGDAAVWSRPSLPRWGCAGGGAGRESLEKPPAIHQGGPILRLDARRMNPIQPGGPTRYTRCWPGSPSACRPSSSRPP